MVSGSALALLDEAFMSCPMIKRASYLLLLGYSLLMIAAAAATFAAASEVPLHTAYLLSGRVL